MPCGRRFGYGRTTAVEVDMFTWKTNYLKNNQVNYTGGRQMLVAAVQPKVKTIVGLNLGNNALKAHYWSVVERCERERLQQGYCYESSQRVKVTPCPYRPQRDRLPILPTATLPSCQGLQGMFPSLPGSRHRLFIAVQIQRFYTSSSDGSILIDRVLTLCATQPRIKL